MSIISKYITVAVGGVAVLSVFLLSSGAINPSWNPFEQPPSGEVLEEAVYNLSQIKKMRIQGRGEIKMNNPQSSLEMGDMAQENIPKEISFGVLFDTLTDYSNEDNKKNSSDINLSLGIEGMEISLKGKIIGVDKNLYLNISSLPEYLPLGFDVGTVKNQWLLIDPQKLGLSNASQATSVMAVKNIEILNDLKKMALGKNVLKIKRNLGKEIIDNEQTKKYLVELEKEGFKTAFPELMDVLGKYVPESQKVSFEQSKAQALYQFEQNFDTVWKQIGGMSFEIWINNDNVLKKISFSKQISESSVEIEVLFSDFNKDVSIEVPLDYKPIEDVLPLDLLNLKEMTSD